MDCESYFVTGDHETLHVRMWNPGGQETAIIWHGVTGSGIDHAPLALHLAAKGFRVLAPDALGCGMSDWARDPAHGYGLAHGATIARTLLATLGQGSISWIGISKGGGLGIRVAGETPGLLARLLLYDVGATLPEEFRASLADRLRSPPRFDNIAAFRDHIARFLARQGLMEMRSLIDRLTIAWSRHEERGAIGYNYDPALANQFVNDRQDFAQWDWWDAITCPVLILRGERSDVLPAAEGAEMLARNRNAAMRTMKDAGHIIFFDDPSQRAAISSFLTSEGCDQPM